MKKFTTAQLSRIAAELFKPQAKKQKPSITMLKVRAAAKKLTAKYRKAK
jgi:hypothetical protein